jgi:two-component system CheB/CheR fusion protein
MPCPNGMAFVLVQHLDPHHPSILPELLRKATRMSVDQATDETPVQPDHVYVIPPKSSLTIEGGVLRVRPVEGDHGPRLPIDRLFDSLAQDQGHNAVCVLFSGSGSDGTIGLRAVKEHGGMVMAQSPETAQHDPMLRSAISTGLVDHVLPPAELADKLMEYAAYLRRLRNQQGPEALVLASSDELTRICTILLHKTGHDFRRYKTPTLVRRIQRRMQVLQAATVAAYVERLHDGPSEADQLFRDLLIGVTHFFRDPEAFAVLASDVIPRLVDVAKLDGTLRVWTPGCSTGEEAYSLAILIREQILRQDSRARVLIFAGDIDDEALEFARNGRYAEGIAEHVTPERLERFFIRHDHVYQVAKEIREMCLFSVHNLIKDPPFSRLDLVVCRNLLIYLEADVQKYVNSLFHYALHPGGYLFLGPSENLVGPPDLFRTVDRKHRIFQRGASVTRLIETLPAVVSTRPPTGRAVAVGHVSGQQALVTALERVLLDRYTPAWVVINARAEALHFSARTGKYLEPATGAPSADVVEMARPGLRLDLRTAIHKAVRTGETVVHQNVLVETNGDAQRINLLVRPVTELGADDGLFLVVFQEVGLPQSRAEAAAEDAATPVDSVIQQLESELRTTKDHLQASVEEVETSNEELKSANEELLATNEELQSSNEELQTSKEELQSINEELETINAELIDKVRELDQANSDLLNLFQATRIPTLFLDGALVIKRFTAAATQVFRLIDSDAGRPITDIAPRFTEDLLPDMKEVLRTATLRERQVHVADGSATYLVRMLPYQRMDNTLDGLAVTFLDITHVRGLQDEARHKDQFLATLSHELRGPLASVQICFEVLQSQGTDVKRGKDALAVAARQLEHLSALVNELLDASRIVTGVISLQRSDQDLVDVVRTSADDQRAMLGGAGVRLDLSLPSTPLWMHCDPRRVGQIVVNLLGNAVKFTDRGGLVTLSLRRDDTTHTAVLSVLDNGLGIEPEMLPRLFEPFSQADTGDPRTRGGLGLGLALVRGLVTAHGGTVEARSDGRGRGAEFTVRLPLLDRSPEAVEPRPIPTGDPRALQHRILIVEDSWDFAESLRSILEVAGHEIQVVADGEGALAKATSFRPDIVLCDIGLPGKLDGNAVATAIRRDATYGAPYLIALSGYGQPSDKARALAAGFNNHVTKGEHPRVLLGLIADVPSQR